MLRTWFKLIFHYYDWVWCKYLLMTRSLGGEWTTGNQWVCMFLHFLVVIAITCPNTSTCVCYNQSLWIVALLSLPHSLSCTSAVTHGCRHTFQEVLLETFTWPCSNWLCYILCALLYLLPQYKSCVNPPRLSLAAAVARMMRAGSLYCTLQNVGFEVETFVTTSNGWCRYKNLTSKHHNGQKSKQQQETQKTSL